MNKCLLIPLRVFLCVIMAFMAFPVLVVVVAWCGVISWLWPLQRNRPKWLPPTFSNN